MSQSKNPAVSHKPESKANFSSMSLLDRIKLRNQCIHQEEPKANPSEIRSTKADCIDIINELATLNPIERANKMSSMIKDYFTNETISMNRSSTNELVAYFKDRTLKEDGPKFKAILKKMCDFQHVTNTWSLKDEYFNL